MIGYAILLVILLAVSIYAYNLNKSNEALQTRLNKLTIKANRKIERQGDYIAQLEAYSDQLESAVESLRIDLAIAKGTAHKITNGKDAPVYALELPGMPKPKNANLKFNPTEDSDGNLGGYFSYVNNPAPTNGKTAQNGSQTAKQHNNGKSTTDNGAIEPKETPKGESTDLDKVSAKLGKLSDKEQESVTKQLAKGTPVDSVISNIQNWRKSDSKK